MARNMEKVWAMADEAEALGYANIETDAESERRADRAAQSKAAVEEARENCEQVCREADRDVPPDNYRPTEEEVVEAHKALCRAEAWQAKLDAWGTGKEDVK